MSATMGPSVARVSAPSTMPSLKTIPAMVVPVFLNLVLLSPLPFAASSHAFLPGRIRPQRKPADGMQPGAFELAAASGTRRPARSALPHQCALLRSTPTPGKYISPLANPGALASPVCTNQGDPLPCPPRLPRLLSATDPAMHPCDERPTYPPAPRITLRRNRTGETFALGAKGSKARERGRVAAGWRNGHTAWARSRQEVLRARAGGCSPLAQVEREAAAGRFHQIGHLGHLLIKIKSPLSPLLNRQLWTDEPKSQISPLKPPNKYRNLPGGSGGEI